MTTLSTQTNETVKAASAAGTASAERTARAAGTASIAKTTSSAHERARSRKPQGPLTEPKTADHQLTSGQPTDQANPKCIEQTEIHKFDQSAGVDESLPDDPFVVGVFDRDGWRCGTITHDAAITLVAVCSEDPADWDEVLGYWPRYVSRVVPEFASQLPLEIDSLDSVIQQLAETHCWLVLDLMQKRILTGWGFQALSENCCFSMYVDEQGNQHDPLGMHLAPWWELMQHVRVESILEERHKPLVVPVCQRSFLFGESLSSGITELVLRSIQSQPAWEAVQLGKLDPPAVWALLDDSSPDLVSVESRGNGEPSSPFQTSDAPVASSSDKCRLKYPVGWNFHRKLQNLTVQVHRDWLMMPQAELNNACPRESLHGGHAWIEHLIANQRLRYTHGDLPIVACPIDTHGYQTAPMGIEEIIVYFHLCRELIDAAWFWCLENLPNTPPELPAAWKRSKNSPPSPHASMINSHCHDIQKLLPTAESSDTSTSGREVLLANPEFAASTSAIGHFVNLHFESLANYLTDRLEAVKDEWLERVHHSSLDRLERGAFKPDASPRFILECSRRRVPRGAGVEIQGMLQRQPASHNLDCSCPICDLVDEGMFGVHFETLDRHVLEMDEEFAFSYCSSYEQWLQEQEEWASWNSIDSIDSVDLIDPISTYEASFVLEQSAPLDASVPMGAIIAEWEHAKMGVRDISETCMTTEHAAALLLRFELAEFIRLVDLLEPQLKSGTGDATTERMSECLQRLCNLQESDNDQADRTLPAILDEFSAQFPEFESHANRIRELIEPDLEGPFRLPR